MYNLRFYGVWRRIRTILASFSFSVFLPIYGEKYREANLSGTSRNAIKTQVINTTREGKSILLLFFYLILNCSVRSFYSHTVTLIITLLRNVMLTVLRQLGQPVVDPGSNSLTYLTIEILCVSFYNFVRK